MSEKVIVSKEKLTAIAENIRTQTKTTELVTLDEMATMKLGTDTSNATATSDDILLGKTAYANDTELVGTIETYDGSSENGEYYETNVAFNMINNSKGKCSYLFYVRSDIAKLLENVIVDDRLVIGADIDDDTISNIASNVALNYAQYVFYSCNTITKLPKLKFGSPSRINSSGNVGEHYEYSFYGCSLLEKIDIEFRCYYGAFLNNLFYNCSNLKEVTIKASEIINANYMFYGCENLETINGNLNLSNTNGSSEPFSKCANLKNVTFGYINGKLQIGSGTTYGHLLTLDSLLSACKACYKSTSTKTLTVGSANLEKLASVYVKITNAESNYLPFVVCEPTDEGAMLITDYMSEKGWTIA